MARNLQRIAFLHIPKTGGIAVVHAFEQALGEDRCIRHAPLIDDASFAQARFVSGHTQLSTITRNAFVFTFLRNPLSQVAGHLSWIDRYNNPVFHEELAALPPGVQRIVSRIAEADFRSPASIAAFLDWLPEDAETRLFNVQSEALAARYDYMAYHDERSMRRAAIRALGQLDFIGITERMPTDLPRLFRRLGLPPPQITLQNTLSSERRLDLTDPAMVAVLSRTIRADLAVYHHAARRTLQGTVGRIHAHARHARHRIDARLGRPAKG